jgi:type IV pilus assembly protein PilV
VQPTVRLDSEGFTFVEVLVALVILMISMLGILNAMTIAMQQNLENYCRDESVRIAEQKMNELRNTSFETLTNGTWNVPGRTYRQFARSFTATWTVNNLSANSRSIQVQVAWTVNKKAHTHSVASIVSRGT